MNGTPDLDFQRDVIHWLARLPFLGIGDLSTLLDIHQDRIAHLLKELEEMGWCEWIVPSSPELASDRLYVLTFPAQDRLAQSAQGCLSIGRRETLTRLTRLETAVAVNRFLSGLTDAIDEDHEFELEDATHLPWAATRVNHPWPSGVEAHARLRCGRLIAPFFVAWDRAGAPAVHRRKRVAGWYTYAESHTWDTPSILVVAPSDREAEEWSQAVIRSADRRGCPPLAVFLTTARRALTNPRSAIWRRADGYAEALLRDRLRWVPEDEPVSSIHPAIASLDVCQLPRAQALRELSADVADRSSRASRVERIAVLSMTTTSLQTTLLEWIGHHPLLTAGDLSILLGIQERLALKALASLEDRDLLQPIANTDGDSPRYVLTSDALHLLAAKDGVPPRRYARHGIVAAPGDGTGVRRLETLVGQFEHTTGTNGFFVRLKRDLDASRGRLLRWLSASEAAQSFTFGERRHWIRPDGYADVRFGGKTHRLFLEWDRGTARRLDHLTQKFQSYAGYLAVHSEQADVPDLVIVTVSPHREAVIWSILMKVFGGQPPSNVLTSIDTLMERLGPLGAVWRSSDSTHRLSWSGLVEGG